MVSDVDPIIRAVELGKVYQDDIIKECSAKGLPRSTIYRRLGSEVKRWSTLAKVKVERTDSEEDEEDAAVAEDAAYLLWSKELDEAFSKPSSLAFTFKLLEIKDGRRSKSFMVEATAKEYCENCKVKIFVITFNLVGEQHIEEFEAYRYPANKGVFNLNPEESVKTLLLNVTPPEYLLKRIDDYEQAYNKAREIDDYRSHLEWRLTEAYKSLERQVVKGIIKTPEHPSGYELASQVNPQVNLLILRVYSKSHLSWCPFLFINEAWGDARPYPIVEYFSSKVAWKKM